MGAILASEEGFGASFGAIIQDADTDPGALVLADTVEPEEVAAMTLLYLEDYLPGIFALSQGTFTILETEMDTYNAAVEEED